MRRPLTHRKKQILGLIRQNARIKKAEIGRRIGIPLTSVACSLASIERQFGIRYVSLLDYSVLGYNVRKIFIISGRHSPIDDHPNLNNLYAIDDCNISAEMVFRNLKEAADFKDSIKDKGVKILGEFFIVEDIKREGFVL